MLEKETYLEMFKTMSSVLNEIDWNSIAKATAKARDAFVREGFTREEAMELIMQTKIS